MGFEIYIAKSIQVKITVWGLYKYRNNQTLGLNFSSFKLQFFFSSEEITKFDNYKLNELEKFICKFSNRINYENKINENFNLIQVLG